MLNDFGKTILAPNLGPLAMPRLASLLDEESKSYFINQKVGKARFDKISNSTDRDLMVEQAKSKLQVVQAALQADPAADQAQTQLSGSRRERSPWIAGGEEPNHADVSPSTFKSTRKHKRWHTKVVAVERRQWCRPSSEE